MITMAKAITNGSQPMGAVGVSDKIYNAIVDNGPEHGVEFFHGYTYSGHPACVAASLATLDIYEKENYSLDQYYNCLNTVTIWRKPLPKELLENNLITEIVKTIPTLE